MNKPKERTIRGQIIIVACICFAAFMCSLDGYIVNVALPDIAHSFGLNVSRASIVTIAYLLSLTSMLIISGRLADCIGMKRMFITGLLLFTSGSLFCGISQSFCILIASRIFQGIGSSILISVSLANIYKYVDPEARGRAFGAISTCSGLGIALGAPLGGVITGTFGWHWIFLINIPVGVLAMLVAIKFIPSDEPFKLKEKLDMIRQFDLTGAILIALSLITFIGIMNLGLKVGWTSLIIILSSIISIVSFISFIIWEQNNRNPLINMNLFRDRNFNLASVSNLTAFMVLSGTNFLLPFYLVIEKGYKAEETGLIMLTFSAVYIVICPFAGWLADKIQPRYLCTAGMLIGVISCMFFVKNVNTAGVQCIIIYLMLLGLSYGLFMSSNNKMFMEFSTSETSGIVSATFKTVSYISFTLGISLFSLIFTLVLPEKMAISSGSVLQSSVNSSLILHGFQNAFSFGALVCLISAILFILIKNEPVKECVKTQ